MAATKKPVLFTREAWERLWAYIELTPGEIGGMGYITENNGNLIVDTVFVLPQTRSTGHVDFAEEAHPITIYPGTDQEQTVTDAQYWALMKAVEDGRSADMKFSWHSHGKISVMWSGTDEEAIAKYGQSTDFLVSMVLNQDHKYRCRADVFNSLGQFTADNLDARPLADSELLDSVITEIDGLTVVKDTTAPEWKSNPTKAGPKSGGGTSTTSNQTKSGSAGGTIIVPGDSTTEYSVTHNSYKLTFKPDGLACLWDPKAKECQGKAFPTGFKKWLEEQGCVIFTDTGGVVWVIDTADSDFAGTAEEIVAM